MIRLTLFILITIAFFCTSAQTISIKDETSNKAVSDIFIYHENKEHLAYSDESGQANLSDFPGGDIYLRHPTYHELRVSYQGSDISVSMKEKIITFNEVVISANKWEQQTENVSQQIMSLNRKSIAFQNPQTSADLLNASGQVFVQKSQLGGGSPKLRGFSANSVLLVVDGVRMNNAIFRSGNLQNIINIDPNALESSEVIFGPGSVIYGSDALGGVMDFYTIDPRWSSDDQVDIKGNFLLRHSTAAKEQTVHADVSVSEKKFTFSHSSSFTAFSDLKAGSNRSGSYLGTSKRLFYVERINDQDQLVRNSDINLQKFSGYSLFNTINKVKVRLSEKSDLNYGFYYSTTTDIPRYDRLAETISQTNDSLVVAEWYYGPQKWQMHSFKYTLYRSSLFFDQLRVTLAYQGFGESRNDRDFGDNELRTRTENVDMYSLSIDADKEFANSSLYYGVDFFHNDVMSEAFRRNLETGEITKTSTRYPSGGSDYTSFATYGSLVINPSDLFTINSGVRFNFINLQARTNNSDVSVTPQTTALSFDKVDISNIALNGAIGAVYHPSESDKLSFNVSTGFRNPNIDDVGKLFELGSDIIVVPNSNIKPEYSVSNELAYQKKTNKFSLNVVGFYSRLFDAIVRGDFAVNGSNTINGLQIRAQVNADEAEVYGGSFLIQAEISDVWAFSNVVTFTDGKDLTKDEPLRHTTPIFGKTSVTYKKDKLRSEFYIEFNGHRKRKDIPSSEIDDKPQLYTSNGSPGWYTLNLKSSYQVSSFLSASVGIENILDRYYRPYTSGISAPGINFIFAVRGGI